jgi:ubiquinone/menaquinone biosynthesis C-methylase UbiE
MRRKWLALPGVLAGFLAARAWRLYDARPRERIASPEALDDPATAHAYTQVAQMPQMALLRRLVAQQAIGLCAAGHAADIGCGPGLLAVELAQLAPGLHVLGIDMAEEMLDQGRRHAAALGVADRVSFRPGDAVAVPCDDASLDLVVSTLSLHHWADPVAVMDEAARCLRPGGAYLIFDLRRDLALPPWLLIWFATRVVVPRVLGRQGEPLASRNAAYTPTEATALAGRSRLTGWRVTGGPFWLTITGRTAA